MKPSNSGKCHYFSLQCNSNIRQLQAPSYLGWSAIELVELIYLASGEAVGPRQLLSIASIILPGSILTVNQAIRKLLRINHKGKRMRSLIARHPLTPKNTTPFDDIADINFDIGKQFLTK